MHPIQAKCLQAGDRVPVEYGSDEFLTVTSVAYNSELDFVVEVTFDNESNVKLPQFRGVFILDREIKEGE